MSIAILVNDLSQEMEHPSSETAFNFQYDYGFLENAFVRIKKVLDYAKGKFPIFATEFYDRRIPKWISQYVKSEKLFKRYYGQFDAFLDPRFNKAIQDIEALIIMGYNQEMCISETALHGVRKEKTIILSNETMFGNKDTAAFRKRVFENFQQIPQIILLKNAEEIISYLNN